jgi:hypothetical protein
MSGTYVDVLAFDAAVSAGGPDSLETAIALYRGPLLEGYEEGWAFQERQVREQTYLTALEVRADQLLALGELTAAELYLRRTVTVDPLRESAQRALMQALAAGGSYAAALQVYRDLRARLHAEVNTEPDPETTSLFQRLRGEANRGDPVPMAPQRPASSPPAALGRRPRSRASEARAHYPSSLPSPTTLLIGRDREVEAACLRLRDEGVRLMTLTGPGGTGKTRLGLQIAASLVDVFVDGVFFVSLAAIRDADRVLPTVAHELGLNDTGSRPLWEVVKEFLRKKRMLLVLDNFEQVLGAAPRIAELLGSCPLLKILVTSRIVLHLYGEQEFPVSPLDLPDRRSLPAIERLSQYAAVVLFIQRAVAAQPDFAVTSENAPAVAEICHRLDGLPLAIELAAARIKVMSPQALLGRLAGALRPGEADKVESAASSPWRPRAARLPLLTGGARDLPARQQTMRNTID